MAKYIVLVILFSLSASGDTIHYSWTASPSDVRLDTCNQWDVIRVDGGMSVFANGYPNLPGVPRCYVIPQGTTVTGVEVSNIRAVSLGRSFLPPPVMILPLSEDVPDHSDYTEVCFAELAGSFPESPVTGFKTGTKTGFRLGSYSFVPFRYSRNSGELFLITSADITLVYEADSEAPVYSLTEGQLELAKTGLATFVDNPEMLDAWGPSQRQEVDSDVELMVIGYLEHQSQLELLVLFHESLGYTSEYQLVQWIQDNMEGYDTPEQIRNYIKDMYLNNGLQFAVLVSDFGETLRHSKLEKPDTTGVMHSFTDLYFSDLDGTWDANGNHLYGEEADEVDYYSDIYVGRYPAYITEIDELDAMIEKSIQYNGFPTAGDWQERVLLMGAALSPDEPEGAWRFGSKTCDSLASFIPDSWEFHRLYEDSAGNHPNHQMEIFNQGTAIAAYAAHGGSPGFFWHGFWEPILHRDSVEFMTNGNKLPWVLGRMSCANGNIRWNCFAEALLKHSGGGAIITETCANLAYIGTTEPSPAQLLDAYFTYALFEHDLVRAGVTHGISKDMFWADWNTFYMPRLAEWHMQETSMLGDPCTIFIQANQGIENQPPVLHSVQVSPNPVRETMSVSVALTGPAALDVTVFDMTGRAVLGQEYWINEAGNHSFAVDSSELASGIYMVQVSSADLTDTSKCVVVH